MSEQRYHVIERIAAGGMAEVYRGESAGIEGFRKKVAIKRVLPKLSANSEFLEMFLDEARLCAYLSHSKCVQVFDIGQGAGAHFIVMEFVDGADLKTVLDFNQKHTRTIPVEVGCLIAMQVCEGLAYAHEAADHAGNPLAIVHRDISPQNVLMTKYGEVKLVDFGLAKASSHLTKEDEDIVKGKFGYLAPEVTMGQGADRRVDIFAAGILLWEMIAGRRLFHGENDVETFKQVRAAQVPDVRQLRPGEVTDDVVYVLAKALARDRDQRYQTADEMAKDLAVCLARIGKPATYVDIAQLVAPAQQERLRRRASEKARDTAGIIGDLVVDALHDFSGPDSQERVGEPESKLGTAGVVAGSGEFIDPSAWDLGGDDDFANLLDPKQPEPEPAFVDAEPVADGEGGPPAQRRRPPPPSQRGAAGDEGEGGPWWRRWFD